MQYSSDQLAADLAERKDNVQASFLNAYTRK